MSQGTVTSIAGLGYASPGYSGDGGPATAAELWWPTGVAVDANDNVYIADQSNDRIRVIYGSGPPWTSTLDPVLDSDEDGYPDLQEMQLGKSVPVYCAIMRADVDADRAVSILDLSRVATYFGGGVPPAPSRLNQDSDLQISVLDLSRQAAHFGQHVSLCP